MKTFFYITLITLIFGVSACTQKLEDPGNPNKFKISKSGPDLTDNEFKNGDQIGLYIVSRANESTAGVLKATGNLYDNKKFIFNSGVMTSDIEHTYPLGIEWVDMYGYAPYSSSGISSDNKLSFSIQENQSSSLAISDLIWIAKKAIKTTTPSPELIFSHKLSKVIIKLTAGVGVTLTNPIVKLNNTLPTVELNIATGVIGTAQGVIKSISTYKSPSASEYHAIIVPQKITTLINFITITNGGKTYSFTLPAAKNFESGKTYDYEITVNSDDLSVKISGSMKDWDTGDTTTGEAT